jgi:hypothetical protein
VTRAAIAVSACLPLLVSCSTGFGSPLRNAKANLQAASASISAELQVQGMIVALPNGTVADKGGVAYLQFTAINNSSQPDELKSASASAVPLAFGSASPAPTQAVDVAEQALPVGSTTVPAKTTQAPGTARLVVALDPLNQQLQQGQSVSVTLEFAKSGSVTDVLVPVQGSEVVGSSFLPSSAPELPSSPPASSAPESSAPESSPAASAS